VVPANPAVLGQKRITTLIALDIKDRISTNAGIFNPGKEFARADFAQTRLQPSEHALIESGH
jgi:hypothetical protein